MKIQRYDTIEGELCVGIWIKEKDHLSYVESKMQQSMRIIRKQKKEIDGLRFLKQVFNMPIEEVNKLLSRYDK